MAALPPLSEIGTILDANAQSAWTSLLDAEKVALAPSTNASDAKYNHALIAVRVIGFFILDFKRHAPTVSFAERAHCTLVQAVHSCWDEPGPEEDHHQELFQLGSHLQNHLIRAFRSNNKSRIATPSAPPSRPSFEKHKEDVLETIHAAPMSHSTVKKQALLRDEYRCKLSGSFDTPSFITWPAVRTMAEGGRGHGYTECCHIFSEGTFQSVNKGENQRDDAGTATAFAILQSFGLESLIADLNGSGVHSLRNIITMELNMHRQFDLLELWLEPTATAHTYTVCARLPEVVFRMTIRPQKQVTFSVPDDVVRECQAKGIPVLALPDPDLIALHAACARVAHMSGAAEYIASLERDEEEMTVLASDGSSAYLLHGLLNLVPAHVGAQLD